VRIGLTGDYVDLDALVFDLINNIIDPWHRPRWKRWASWSS
jgi:hypothetical protein